MDEQLYYLVNDCGQCWSRNGKDGEWSIFTNNAYRYTKEQIDRVLSRNLDVSWHKIKAD